MSIDPSPVPWESPADRVLLAAAADRFHIGLVLVARLRLTPVEALSLTWDDLDPAGGLHLPTREVAVPGPFVRLLAWHQARQRLDALADGRVFDPCGPVVADRHGRPYTLQHADEATAALAVEAGLPPVPMAALRHPSLQ